MAVAITQVIDILATYFKGALTMTDINNQNIGTLPVLPVKNVTESLDCYVNVLGFSEVFHQNDDQGQMINAQVQMSGCHIMLNLNPAQSDLQGGGVYFWIRVADLPIDKLYESIKAKNIKIEHEIEDQFWGDRSFTVRDSLGYYIAFTQKIAD